jgi:glycosyltransferase involved in cell wall biosynthesis
VPQTRPLSNALREGTAAAGRSRIDVSVVVPTRNRPDALGSCLAALAAQTLLPRMEIVVVDDGSEAAGAVVRVVERFPHARLIRLDGQGPAVARNTGARAAAGSFLCFTDDDCEPAADWSEHLVSRLEAGAHAVAGVTIGEGSAAAVASEIVAHAPAAVPVPDGHEIAFAPSNNIACTRETFAATPFDESFPDAAGEDREWCARLIANGGRLSLEPKARLVHNQELTLRRFLGQQARYGRGAYRFRRRGVNRPFEPTSFYWRLLRLGFAEGLAVGLLVSAAQAATAGGYVREWLADRGDVSLGRARGEERPRSEQPPPT